MLECVVLCYAMPKYLRLTVAAMANCLIGIVSVYSPLKLAGNFWGKEKLNNWLGVEEPQNSAEMVNQLNRRDETLNFTQYGPSMILE